jgi:hypothetical protein
MQPQIPMVDWDDIAKNETLRKDIVNRMIVRGAKIIFLNKIY